METKPLLYGLIGFFIGGFIVSVAATTFDKPAKQHSANGGMSMNDMVTSLDGKTGDDFDKAFISGMIEHHQGAIDMAELAQKSAKHGEVKDMANDIVTAQSKEIEMMRTWQAQWGYAHTPANGDATGH